MFLIPTVDDVNILYDRNTLAQRVNALATKISIDYSGGEIYMIAIMKGAIPFAQKLALRIDPRIPLFEDYMMLSSYGDKMESSGKVKVVLDLGHSIAGKDVLVVEDIIDTGRTMHYLLENLLKPRQPKSIRVCTLLDKPCRRIPELREFRADYTGFTIQDKFVVGSGMDYNGYCRNWPFVGVLKDEFLVRAQGK